MKFYRHDIQAGKTLISFVTQSGTKLKDITNSMRFNSNLFFSVSKENVEAKI
jgi:hypothetical protein